MALTIRSKFGLQVPPQKAWELLNDIERASPCFPGAMLQGQNEDGSWKAAFLVKLGPMSFTFAGRFQIVEADPQLGRVLIKAQGSDTKGRGGASAGVEVTVSGQDQAADVAIVSTVDLSGSVAQFGRGAGMIEALSQQLVNQFATNLQRAMAKSQAMGGGASDAAEADATHTSGNEQAAASLNAGGLVLRTLWSATSNAFTRKSEKAGSDRG